MPDDSPERWFLEKPSARRRQVPKASRFAVLRLPGRLQDLIVRDMEAAARQLGVRLHVLEVRRVEDLSVAFNAAIAEHARGVMSTQGPFFVHNNVLDRATRAQAPATKPLR
jgi:hypothetical protein